MKDSGIEIINIFQNEDDEKKAEIVTQKMQKIINSRINAKPKLATQNQLVVSSK